VERSHSRHAKHNSTDETPFGVRRLASAALVVALGIGSFAPLQALGSENSSALINVGARLETTDFYCAQSPEPSFGPMSLGRIMMSIQPPARNGNRVFQIHEISGVRLRPRLDWQRMATSHHVGGCVLRRGDIQCDSHGVEVSMPSIFADHDGRDRGVITRRAWINGERAFCVAYDSADFAERWAREQSYDVHGE
jgi:hypothetical protein